MHIFNMCSVLISRLISQFFASDNINRISAITLLDFSPISRSRELIITKLAWLLNALAHLCTSWWHHLRSWVQTLGTKPRAIMWLLVGGVAKVQAPPWEAYQELVFACSFCGCS